MLASRTVWEMSVGKDLKLFNWETSNFVIEASEKIDEDFLLIWVGEIGKNVSKNCKIIQLRATDFSTEANC